jgi:hypothetical protein
VNVPNESDCKWNGRRLLCNIKINVDGDIVTQQDQFKHYSGLVRAFARATLTSDIVIVSSLSPIVLFVHFRNGIQVQPVY